MRVVIDTGVAVSAVLLPRSVPRQAFDLVLARGRLLVSEATIRELDEVFRRPKFNKYLPEEKRMEVFAALVQAAEVVEIAESISECRIQRTTSSSSWLSADRRATSSVGTATCWS